MNNTEALVAMSVRAHAADQLTTALIQHASLSEKIPGSDINTVMEIKQHLTIALVAAVQIETEMRKQ
jgi:hypothetical protein